MQDAITVQGADIDIKVPFRRKGRKRGAGGKEGSERASRRRLRVLYGHNFRPNRCNGDVRKKRSRRLLGEGGAGGQAQLVLSHFRQNFGGGPQEAREGGGFVGRWDVSVAKESLRFCGVGSSLVARR